MDNVKEFKKKVRSFKKEIKALTPPVSELSGIQAYAVAEFQKSFRSFVYSYDAWLKNRDLFLAMEVAGSEWRFLAAMDFVNQLRRSRGGDTHEVRMFIIDCTEYVRKNTVKL